MNEINNSSKQTGTPASQQTQMTCPKSFKPWILTLLMLALLTLGWVVFESYRGGGIVAHMFGHDGKVPMEYGKAGDGVYSAVNLPVVNTMQDSYHTIIDVVRPALVSIDVAVTVPAAGEDAPIGGLNPIAGAPVTNYTRVGSGVIIADKGYVLTSYHVVEGATAMKGTVYGPGGAIDYPLKLVNVDKTTDLALLRILGDGPFPHAILGDSDAVRTGDVVLAMGSPFGFDQTITTGIISSKNRTVTIGGKVFEGMFQTEAPINKGNSGGPLVNARGEVIAINTAIYSPTGAFSGIGFAIPVNQAASLVGGVVDFEGVPPQAAGGQLAAWTRMGRQTGNSYKLPNGQILTPPHPYRGKCVECHPQLCPTPGQGGGRGLVMGPGSPRNGFAVAAQGVVKSDPYLGAALLDVDELIAKQFNLAHAGGVLVDRVMPGSPAEAAGIQRGDVILRLDGRRIQDINELQKVLTAKKPGAAAELAMMSNGARKTVKVRFVQEPVAVPPSFAPVQGPQARQPAEFEWFGAEITPLIPAIQAYVNSGVYVAETGGVLGAAGVLKGDVIKSVNNHAVGDMISFIRIAKKVNVKDGILLDVIRGGRPMYITVKG
ncbi:MAG: trypsin-like peptidase domain-containing protein [Nitrospirae bacterium]|nr:trypsin-like peptidase domain-containing protein [Nitrospirota bacterium]